MHLVAIWREYPQNRMMRLHKQGEEIEITMKPDANYLLPRVVRLNSR
jgi:hypothetical protein